jgi:hypothetical protein
LIQYRRVVSVPFAVTDKQIGTFGRGFGSFQQEDTAMTDDKNKSDYHDRDRALVEEAYEIAHIARKFQLTMPEARYLIRRCGNNRTTLEQAARKLAYQPR